MGLHILFEPLQKEHERRYFTCGEPALDHYLQNLANQDIRRDIASIFVAKAGRTKQVIAFYTLSATSIPLSDFPENAQRKLPRYPMVPGFLLGRLAVDKSWRGKGLGARALIHALENALRTSRKHIAAAFVIVEAKNDSARAFYEKFGFKSFSDQPLRLFISMKPIEKALVKAAQPQSGPGLH